MDTLTRENYFQYGTSLEDFVVTSSSLQHLFPDQGGSILRFIKYITGNSEKKESTSLSRGTLIHTYLENPESFKLAPESKPSEAVCQIVEDVYDTIKFLGVNPENLSDHPAQIILSANKFRYGVAGKWGSDVIIRKVREKGDAYFKHLIETSDSIVVDDKTKLILYNIMSTFENREDLRKFIDNTPEGFDKPIVYKELPILFETKGFKCKSLIDRVEVDHEKKIVIIYDYKSTSKPVGIYMGSKVLNLTLTSDNITYEYVPGAFQEYHTYRQLAFYRIAISHWLKENGFNPTEYKYGMRIVACETVDPYEVRVYPINVKWILAGASEIETCMNILTKNISQINPPNAYEY